MCPRCYVPKVPRAQVITLAALPSTEDEQTPRPLCPVLALRVYIEHSSQFRQSEQICVASEAAWRGCESWRGFYPIGNKFYKSGKFRLYKTLGLQYPFGVRAHSTRGMASSWAWSSGMSIADICAMASWSSLSIFARFYKTGMDFVCLTRPGLSPSCCTNLAGVSWQGESYIHQNINTCFFVFWLFLMSVKLFFFPVVKKNLK